MPPISAIVHTQNDALHIGRALESLRACSEVVVLDHGSGDGTPAIAREHGARVVSASQMTPATAAGQAAHSWILVVRPNEAVAELLEAELYELRLQEAVSDPSFAFVVLEETKVGWAKRPAETRLVPRDYTRWEGELPAQDSQSRCLEGFLLRFRQ
jgi:glycosyltransferase involved in cell wall biosynthesis